MANTPAVRLTVAQQFELLPLIRERSKIGVPLVDIVASPECQKLARGVTVAQMRILARNEDIKVVVLSKAESAQRGREKLRKQKEAQRSRAAKKVEVMQTVSQSDSLLQALRTLTGSLVGLYKELGNPLPEDLRTLHNRLIKD